MGCGGGEGIERSQRPVLSFCEAGILPVYDFGMSGRVGNVTRVVKQAYRLQPTVRGCPRRGTPARLSGSSSTSARGFTMDPSSKHTSPQILT